MTSWTLFLDRDGVLNAHLEGSYVLSADDLRVLPGAAEALVLLREHFDPIVVVTNQQAVAKGLLEREELDSLHEALLDALGGPAALDAIFVCPHRAGTCNCRKPLTGMALRARERFPEIDFERSVMVGDQPLDMEFAAALGMRRVQLLESGSNRVVSPLAQETAPSLLDWARSECLVRASFTTSRRQ